MIYRNIILENCALTASILDKLPLHIETNTFNRDEYKFFGINLTPHADANKFIFINNGSVYISYTSERLTQFRKEIIADKITITTEIIGLYPQKELEYYLKFGKQEDIFFN